MTERAGGAALRHDRGRGSGRDGWRRAIARRVFAPREILLRSAGRVYFLRLTPWRQRAAMLATTALLAWGLFATQSYFAQRQDIAARDEALAAVRLDYEQLLGEVDRYQGQFRTLTTALDESQAQLADFLAGEPLPAAPVVDRAERVADAPEDAQAAAGSAMLRGYLERIGGELQAIVERNDALGVQVAKLRGRLETTEAARDEILADRRRLYRQLDETRGALRAQRNLGEALSGDLETARASLARVRAQLRDSAELRAGLEQRARILERAAQAGERREAALTERLSQAQAEVAALTRAGAAQEREIAGLQAAQAEATARAERLDAELAKIDASLAQSDSRVAALLDEKRRQAARIGELDAGLATALEQRQRSEAALAETRAELAESERGRRAARDLNAGQAERIAELETRLAALRDRETELAMRLAETRSTLAASRKRGDEAGRQRDRQAATVVRLESSLAAAATREGGLRDALSQTSEVLAGSRQETADLRRERDAQGEQIKLLEGAYGEVRRDSGALLARLAQAERGLRESRRRGDGLANLSDEQSGQIAELRAQLAAGAQRARGLEQTLERLTADLSGSERRARDLAEQRDRLRQRADELGRALASERQAKEALFAKLTERAVATIDSIERAVGITGLDVDKLLPTATGEEDGKGGPFIPLSLDAAAPSGMTLSLPEDVAGPLQRWEAMVTLLAALPLWTPVKTYRLSSAFGPRRDPLNGRKAMHAGLDMAAPSRTPVTAPAPGRVVSAGWKSGYGRVVEIDHGYGLRTLYAHLRKIETEIGATVRLGERIGQVGSSGRSTGSHLHYEVVYNGKPLNPANFLKAGEHVRKG